MVVYMKKCTYLCIIYSKFRDIFKKDGELVTFEVLCYDICY